MLGVAGEQQPPLPAKPKRMSVTIQEHLTSSRNGVMDAVEDLTSSMRLKTGSNPSISASTRARLESRRVSTGPMALSM